MPVLANFTMIGAGTLVAGVPGDGNGGVWRRGTGSTVFNGVPVALHRHRHQHPRRLDRLALDRVGRARTRSGSRTRCWRRTASTTTPPAPAIPRPRTGTPVASATMLAYATDVQVDTLLGYTLTPPIAQLQAEGRLARHHGRPDHASADAGDQPHRRTTSVAAGSTRRTSAPWIPAAATPWYSGWTVYQTN